MTAGTGGGGSRAPALRRNGQDRSLQNPKAESSFNYCNTIVIIYEITVAICGEVRKFCGPISEKSKTHVRAKASSSCNLLFPGWVVAVEGRPHGCKGRQTRRGRQEQSPCPTDLEARC